MSAIRIRHPFLALFSVLACVAVGLFATRAAAATWTGLGGDDNWSTGGNWDTPPANNTVLVFDGTTRLTNTNNIAAGQDYGLDFADTAGSFELSGKTSDLRAVSGNVRIRSYSPNVQTINLDLNLLGNTEFRFEDATAYGGSIILNGDITETGGPRTLTLWGPYDSSSPYERGAFTLAGNNSYSGTTTLGANFRRVDLTLGHANALGTGSVAVPVANNRIQASVDLTGANRIENAISVNIGGDNALYVACSHSIELNGPVSFTTKNNLRTLRNDIVAGKTLTINDLKLDWESAAYNRRLEVNGTGTTIIGGVSQVAGSTATAGMLHKTGSGVLRLQSANTSTTTVIDIRGGVLVVEHADAIPGGLGSSGGTANIIISQGGGFGILGLGSGDLTRSLGTGAHQLQFGFNGQGGFAAYGADRVVNLGGASGGVTWNSGKFVTGTFGLGAASATHTLDFQNPINLGTAVRTVRVDDGAADVDGVLSGVLSGSGSSGLIKTGAGTFYLNATNTYLGATTVSAGHIGGNGSIAGDLVMSGGGFAAQVGVTLHVAGSVDLSAASDSIVLAGAEPAARTVVLTYAASLSGTFDNTDGLPSGYSVDYSCSAEPECYRSRQVRPGTALKS